LTTSAATLADDGLGGLSHNGGFEQSDDDQPAGWSKFGGEMDLTDQAYQGRWAARLSSAGGSTKWLFQVIPVTPGSWYEVAGVARIEHGAGDASIRLSWYAGPQGDGQAIATADSRLASGEDWSVLALPATQAPPGAGSVRLRLMLRASGPAAAAFDDVVLRETSAPTAEAVGSNGTSRTTDAAPANPSALPGAPLTTNSAEQPLAVGGPDGLRLSEILSNPAEPGRDSAFEWVELFNTGDRAVSTEGWKLGDSSSLDALPSVTLPPGSWIVVAGKSATFADDVPVIRPADGEIGSGLGNDGDLVRLVRPDGTVADLVSYGSNTTATQDPPLPAPAEDQTIGVQFPTGEAEPADWAVTLRPTPGESNVFATATPTSKHATTRTNATPASQTPAATLVSVQRGAHDGSVVPSILLSVAGGAGILASVQLGVQALPRIRKRWRRGR